MDFYEVIRTRRSVRSFKKDPIPKETLNRVLNAACVAPCWIGAFNNDEIRKLLGVPEEYEVVAATPLGYPSMEVFTDPRNRKNLDEIVSVDRF